MTSPPSLDLDVLPASLQKFVKRELRSDEAIVWLGRPGREPIALPILVVLSGAVSMTLFGVMVATMVGSTGMVWTIVGVVLLIVVLALAGILNGMKQDRYTAYVITNRRAFIVEQSIWFFPPIVMERAQSSSFGPSFIANSKLRREDDDRGTVVFATRRERDNDGHEQIHEIGFRRISDAKAVHGLLLHMTRGIGVTPPPEPARLAPLPLVGSEVVPNLVDPPRRVPIAIQFRLFVGHGWLPMIGVGTLFVVVSLAFIVPPFFSADDGPLTANEIGWRLFPCIHLLVGLGLFMTPIILWRRRVAILRHGLLARIRVIAYQDANLNGSWTPFNATTFDRSSWFTGISMSMSSPPSDSTPSTASEASEASTSNLVQSAMGCLLGMFALAGLLFALAGIGTVWFGGNSGQAIGEKVLMSFGVVAVAGIYIGVASMMWLGLKRAFASMIGNSSSGALLPSARFRFAFVLPTEERVEATGPVDLQSWHNRVARGGDALAIYLPENPQRVWLLEGVRPAIVISEGNLT